MASHVQDSRIMATTKEQSPLAFVFKGNEMIVQCTANIDDEAGALQILDVALRNYQNFNGGKHAAIVRCKGSTQYWITSVPFAQALNKDSYTIIKSTIDAVATVQAPVTPSQPVTCEKVTKVHIRRPRNQFIIYRQWMSTRIHATNPGVTAGCVSQIVAQKWRTEKPEVKAHFKALADEEDRTHKAMYPGYRYEAGRRSPQLALSKRNLTRNPMKIAERLIAAGF